MVDYKALGGRIRQLRRAAGMTQGKLAGLVGISGTFLGHIERGTRIMSLETLVALCAALQVTPNDVIGYMPTDPFMQLPDRLQKTLLALVQEMLDSLKKAANS